MIFMVELDARSRQLELENIPFAEVPAVLPSLENDGEICVVCRVEERTHALIPCGHKVLCEECVYLLEPKRGPICNVDFTTSIRIW
ncbi:unnamed protein product [Macrosiphum euphorbiae]|uniref:RING-type domain-containing protein n=1 Tax=Macrosiphum euphorbiae TaxID=13131 RepID=A0AAV0Y0B5_9HEMI|nr:unnamed protein product [Macrosiphum euphorbiae]